MKKVHTLILGSGAAGLCAAVRLHAEGIDDLLLVSEGLDRGTSINTGSDKQTYYKLSLCGRDDDSPVRMAETLCGGGAMHGDLALVEAALSARAFLHLTNLGVRFPTDRFGQFVGYKTDHDPYRRATSVGPYTSRDMCRALIDRIRQLPLPVLENLCCVQLLALPEKNGMRRVCGAIFLDENGSLVPILAENIILAVGGPGGLYETSVYPACHTGGIGLALAIGAEARNLTESQFGMGSIRFRWNVSGTYMQVLPRFVSTDPDGGDEKEFLLDYFDTPSKLYDNVFLKGYQWPFDVRKVVGGSSILDILVHIETVKRRRRVFLDYRSNPLHLSFEELGEEAHQYLKKSNALFGTPIRRLEAMNPGAIELYAVNGIDLHREMLEIAVCAQHNNGGLAGTLWWESTNIKHLFPIGEVNGSHGVTRPGGSALNAGQVGGFRAAEYIARHYSGRTLDVETATRIARDSCESLVSGDQRSDWPDERRLFQSRMSEAGALIRAREQIDSALRDAWRQYHRLPKQGQLEELRNTSLCLSHAVYLDAIAFALRSGLGSRGSALAVGLPEESLPIHPALNAAQWNMIPENEIFRKQVLVTRYDPESGKTHHRWEPCRPIPAEDLWFESAWKEFREGKIYED